MNMFGKYGKIEEGKTRNELKKSTRKTDKGFETDEDYDGADIASV